MCMCMKKDPAASTPVAVVMGRPCVVYTIGHTGVCSSSVQMKLVVIGQAAFGAEVLKKLVASGHDVRAVLTVPDAKPGTQDQIADAADSLKLTVHKFKRLQGLKKDGGKVALASRWRSQPDD